MREYHVVLRDFGDRRRYAYEVRADGAQRAIARARAKHTRTFAERYPRIGITQRPAGVVDVA